MTILNGRRIRDIAMDAAEYMQKLKSRGLGPDGRQAPDPVPLAPPIGYKKTPSMVEIVREMVRSERLRQEALAADHETFEEADDFDVGDEPELMRSPFEYDERDPSIRELAEIGRQALKEKEAAAAAAGKGGEGGSPPSPVPPKGEPKAP